MANKSVVRSVENLLEVIRRQSDVIKKMREAKRKMSASYWGIREDIRRLKDQNPSHGISVSQEIERQSNHAVVLENITLKQEVAELKEWKRQEQILHKGTRERFAIVRNSYERQSVELDSLKSQFEQVSKDKVELLAANAEKAGRIVDLMRELSTLKVRALDIMRMSYHMRFVKAPWWMFWRNESAIAANLHNTGVVDKKDKAPMEVTFTCHCGQKQGMRFID